MDHARKCGGREKRRVKPSFNHVFQQLADKRAALEKKMETERLTVEKDVMVGGKGAKKGETVSMQDHVDGRHVFRVVKKAHGDVMKKSDGGKKYESVVVKKNEFLFITKTLAGLSREYRKVEADYLSAQQELCEKCCDIATTFVSVLEKMCDQISSLDVLASYALVVACAKTKFVRPEKIKEDGEMIVHGATHPLVEENLYGSKNFIPNDCIMGPESGRLVVITGPNMGGKSTYIRQVALSALMNQIGMFVPANRCVERPVFSSIMARVGASDAQLKGISTFMAEMLESSTILRSADARSLVIVDELGRGTSTQDGYGLAYAIAKYLCCEKKCLTLFATHFHELGELKDELGAAVQNKHATALVDGDNLTFLYEMKNGVADQSYGCHVARAARFPTETIKRAQETADYLEAHAKKRRVEPTPQEAAVLHAFGDHIFSKKPEGAKQQGGGAAGAEDDGGVPPCGDFFRFLVDGLPTGREGEDAFLQKIMANAAVPMEQA
eukprot:gene235-106_t